MGKLPPVPQVYHEEMDYFKVKPGDGFGICHYYNEEGEDENFTVRDNSIHMMPRGYHTVGRQRSWLHDLLPVGCPLIFLLNIFP